MQFARSIAPGTRSSPSWARRPLPLSLAHSAANARGKSIGAERIALAAKPRRLFTRCADKQEQTQDQDPTQAQDDIPFHLPPESELELKTKNKGPKKGTRKSKADGDSTATGESQNSTERAERAERAKGANILMLIAKNKADLPAKSAIWNELRWLQDPLALANRVRSLLKAGRVALAAAVLRQAQHERIKSDVGWHYLIDYCFEKKSVPAAMRFWNDVCFGFPPFSLRIWLC